jgi:RimJ/RimL family protein N-acetyltransferase
VDSVWPVAALRARCEGVRLRPATESDVVALTRVLPDDYELDPTAADAGTSRPLHLLRSYWRDQAEWRPASWRLHLLATTDDGRPIGMQTMEAEDFGTARTVDSASWVAVAHRRRGAGRAMRTAMLALAFDALGARRAITSAWRDNLPSLAVSARLGYVVDRVERRAREVPGGQDDLVHLHLDAAAWRAASRPEVVLSGVSAAAVSAFV